MRNALFVALVAIGACSTSEQPSQIAQALTPSQPAITVLQALRSKYVIHFNAPPSHEQLIKEDETPIARSAQVLIASDVDQVQQNGNQLSAVLKHASTLSVTLPDRASGSADLKAANSLVRVTLVGANAAPAELADGYLVYLGGAPGGGHLVRLPTPEGVEDFLTFESAPQSASVDYTIELLSGAVGLRLVENTLELLDSKGVPQLRVRRPYLVDSTGKGVSAQLSVVGCAVDTNPRGPWGRAITAPNATKCTLHVSWNNASLTFPALLDPSWSSTGTMVEPRSDHRATRLDDGRVLATCGVNAGPVQPGAELYDPTTNTWSATASPTQKRTDHVATKLANGKVLIAGGTFSSGLRSTEIYDPAAGSWSTSGDLTSIRRVFIAERLANGKVLAAGGYTGRGILATAELFDPSTGAWTSTGSMATARAAHRSSVLANNNVMVTGGVNPSYQSTAEIYSQSAGTWSTGGSMTTARANHGQVSLAYGGRVIVGGGYTGSATTASVDRWDPSTNTWSAGPSLVTARMNMGFGLAGGAKVLFAAGQGASAPTATSELLQNYPPTMESSPSLTAARSNFPVVVLADGRLLASGGVQGSSYLAAAEVFDPTQPAGSGSVYDQNSPPRLTMEWDDEDPIGSYSLSSGSLNATVKNNTDSTLTAYVDVVASGLDERLATRTAFFNITVPAWGSTALNVPMSVWPIRSVGAESEVYLKLREYVTGQGDTGFIDYSTERRYELNSTYTTVTLHGIRGKDLDRTQPTPASSLAQLWTNFATATSGIDTVTGKVWNGSDFVDVSTLTPPSNGARNQYAMLGQLPIDFINWKNSLVVDYSPPGGSPSLTLCARWPAKFLDGSIGSFLTTTNHPASYAFAIVRVWSWTAWFGQLDVNGCTPPIAIAGTAPVYFVTHTFLQNGGTIGDIQFGPNQISQWVPVPYGGSYTGLVESFSAPSTSQSLTFNYTGEDFNTRSAAVVGRALSMPDNGFTSNTYIVQSNTGCNRPELKDQYCKHQEACGAGLQLNIGWVLAATSAPICGDVGAGAYVRAQKHNTQYKGVIAHELGHCVQSTMFGTINAGAPTLDVKKPGAPPYQCTCDFVLEGNQLHCLQSREEERQSIVEAYGHFYASRVSNDYGQSPCNFPYYKTKLNWQWNSFLQTNTWIPNAPPISVACTGPASNGVGWMEDQCKNNGTDNGSIANRGTEWDWMTFLYDVSRSGASGIPFADPNSNNAGLARVWMNACGGGSWGQNCGTLNNGFQNGNVSATIWWGGFNGGQGLQSSVTQLWQQYNQLTTQQKDNFVNLGTLRGVNH